MACTCLVDDYEFPRRRKNQRFCRVIQRFIAERSRHCEVVFGGPALRDGQLSLRAGSVHALCGGNGAGKSTFLNILMGILQRDAGSIQVNGQEVVFHTPKQALQAGVSIITQELSPVRGMTVA